LENKNNLTELLDRANCELANGYEDANESDEPLQVHFLDISALCKASSSYNSNKKRKTKDDVHPLHVASARAYASALTSNVSTLFDEAKSAQICVVFLCDGMDQKHTVALGVRLRRDKDDTCFEGIVDVVDAYW
jgi:hypothetical protein